MEKEGTIIPKAHFACLRNLLERRQILASVGLEKKLLPPKVIRQAERIATKCWQKLNRQEYLEEMNA